MRIRGIVGLLLLLFATSCSPVMKENTVDTTDVAGYGSVSITDAIDSFESRSETSQIAASTVESTQVAESTNSSSQTTLPTQVESVEQILQFQISDTAQHTLSLMLPTGWTIVESKAATPNADQKLYLYLCSLDKKYICDETGEYVGAIDCMAYSTAEDQADNPRAIFVKLTLGNGYQFDLNGIHGTPAQVIEHTHGKTYLTDVYYSAAFRSPFTEATEKLNRGILCYNRDAKVYAALEFERDLVEEEILLDIAMQIQWITAQ